MQIHDRKTCGDSSNLWRDVAYGEAHLVHPYPQLNLRKNISLKNSILEVSKILIFLLVCANIFIQFFTFYQSYINFT